MKQAYFSSFELENQGPVVIWATCFYLCGDCISQPLNENNNTTNNFLNTCFVHLLCAQLPSKPQLLFPMPCWAAGIIPISQMRL